jgi:hypothetical protein
MSDVSSDNLDLRVVFLDHSVQSVTISGAEDPSSITLLGPPVECPVYVLHQGRCLSPFLSLSRQGVKTGDLLVLHGLKDPPEHNCAHPRDHAGTAFHEQLRLADISFLPYETLPCVSPMYDQMLGEAEAMDAANFPPQQALDTVLGEKPEQIPTGRLPPCWVVPRTKRKADKPAEDGDASAKQSSNENVFL